MPISSDVSFLFFCNLCRLIFCIGYITINAQETFEVKSSGLTSIELTVDRLQLILNIGLNYVGPLTC